MGALRRALKPQTDRDLNEVPHLSVRARSGCWLTLHGFDKIGVRDRRALVKRLYLDAILPVVL
jgi:hypothetical protein